MHKLRNSEDQASENRKSMSNVLAELGDLKDSPSPVSPDLS